VINFRYHVVSLTAVFLALAAGLVLGAGFLDQTDDDGATSGDTTDPGVRSFDTGYASRTAPVLAKDKLKDRTILVVTTPGARAADVKGVRTSLEQAGATIVGQIELTSKLLDPGGRQFADGVADKAGADVAEVSTAATGYPRIGAALGRAYLTRKDATVDEAATQLSAAFDEGGLVRVDTKPSKRAALAVVVTADRSSANSQQGSSLGALVTALDLASGGVVVSGPSSASLDGGLIAAVRSDEGASQVSTVDVADLPAGRTVVALAAASEVAGRSGAWGTSRSADGALPQ